jgi:hypothetical protein
MSLSLKVLNSDATLNSFFETSTFSTIRGSDIAIVLRLFQPDKKIRYIPSVSAVITMDFLKSDGTSISKTASFPFSDDRSIIQFSLSDTETALLISQSLLVKVVEGTITTYAVLQSGFQIISLGVC